MIWIGLILGAIFGWVGLLIAAAAWLAFSLAKLAIASITVVVKGVVAIIAFEIGRAHV